MEAAPDLPLLFQTQATHPALSKLTSCRSLIYFISGVKRQFTVILRCQKPFQDNAG
jgi:hypothetical protein